MKKRLPFILLFIFLAIIEILIAVYIHDSFVRPYVGDALVVVALYAFVRSIAPRGIKHLAFYVFCFAAAVEVLQLLNIPGMLGINSGFVRILLGSTFDFKDILCYGIGCLIITFIEHIRRKRCH